MKLYTDAARGEYVSGIGYIIEHDGGTIADNRILHDRYTSMEAEFHGLAEGLRIASQRVESDGYCEAYSDCRPLIDKMRGTERRSDEWETYYDSCQWLLSKFDDYELRYCSRSKNERAHELARAALDEGRKG